jgi:hypothetical protein
MPAASAQALDQPRATAEATAAVRAAVAAGLAVAAEWFRVRRAQIVFFIVSFLH